MTTDDLGHPLDPAAAGDVGPANDPLSLAEAVAAGQLAESTAVAMLRSASPADPRRAEAGVAELRGLIAAIHGVQRHAVAFRDTTQPNRGAASAGSSGRPGDSSHPAADRSLQVERVGGNVRSRPAAGGSRWAPGLVAVAAVVVVAIVVGSNLATGPIASTPSPGGSGIGAASPSGEPSAASPSNSPAAPVTPGPSPVPTGVAGVPPIASQPLPGAPGVAYWTLAAEDRIAVAEWRPDGGRVGIGFSVDTWPDPSGASGSWIDRAVIASPDGQRIAFAETASATRARLRVFGPDGSTLWIDPSLTPGIDLAWSPDSTALAIGHQPGEWRIVTFAPGATPAVASFDLGGAYALLGFSRSGQLLFGYDSNGEAEYWQTPIVFPRAGGTPKRIVRFSGLGDPLGTSNGTTPISMVDPVARGRFNPGVDPVTGRVLDTGGLSGRLSGWELRDGSTATPLDTGSSAIPELAWGPDGSIVIVNLADARAAFQLRNVNLADPSAPIRPVFDVPTGGYWQAFYGVRGPTAVLGFAAARAHDAPYLGADELVAVDVATAGASVLVPESAGLTGLHAAGWITAPPPAP